MFLDCKSQKSIRNFKFQLNTTIQRKENDERSFYFCKSFIKIKNISVIYKIIFSLLKKTRNRLKMLIYPVIIKNISTVYN